MKDFITCLIAMAISSWLLIKVLSWLCTLSIGHIALAIMFISISAGWVIMPFAVEADAKHLTRGKDEHN